MIICSGRDNHAPSFKCIFRIYNRASNITFRITQWWQFYGAHGLNRAVQTQKTWHMKRCCYSRLGALKSICSIRICNPLLHTHWIAHLLRWRKQISEASFLVECLKRNHTFMKHLWNLRLVQLLGSCALVFLYVIVHQYIYICHRSSVYIYVIVHQYIYMSSYISIYISSYISIYIYIYIWEYWIEIVTMDLLFIRFVILSEMICRGDCGFATGWPCGVWFRELTVYLIYYVNLLFC